MDTRTGEIIALDKEKAKQAATLWTAWKSGALPEMPRYAPITGDSVPVTKKRRR